jgi:hypothetical protein
MSAFCSKGDSFSDAPLFGSLGQLARTVDDWYQPQALQVLVNITSHIDMANQIAADATTCRQFLSDFVLESLAPTHRAAEDQITEKQSYIWRNMQRHCSSKLMVAQHCLCLNGVESSSKSTCC